MQESLDYSTALSTLQNLPLCILILEHDRVCWANKRLLQTLHTSENALIGLRAKQATGTVFAPLFENSEHLCLTEEGGVTRWLKRERVRLDPPTLQAHFFEDVTSLVKLEEEYKKLSEDLSAFVTNDSLTGLLNCRAIMQALDLQISRSRRYGNPLALLRISLVCEPPEKDTLLKSISEGLKTQLRWVDQIGMLDSATFLIILPETTLEDAKELAAKLANDRAILIGHSPECSMKFGVASWNQGDDPHKLLQRLQKDQELSLVALLS